MESKKKKKKEKRENLNLSLLQVAAAPPHEIFPFFSPAKSLAPLTAHKPPPLNTHRPSSSPSATDPSTPKPPFLGSIFFFGLLNSKRPSQQSLLLPWPTTNSNGEATPTDQPHTPGLLPLSCSSEPPRAPPSSPQPRDLPSSAADNISPPP